MDNFPCFVLRGDSQNHTEILSCNHCIQNSANKLLHAPNRCFPFRLMHHCGPFFLPQRNISMAINQKASFQHPRTYPGVAKEVARREGGEAGINFFMKCSPYFHFSFPHPTFCVRDHLRYSRIASFNFYSKNAYWMIFFKHVLVQ